MKYANVARFTTSCDKRTRTEEGYENGMLKMVFLHQRDKETGSIDKVLLTL
jgi:hypothetical protein